MKIIAVIEVASSGALDLPSQWQCDLGGEPLLKRTVAALTATGAFTEVIIAVDAETKQSVSQILSGAGVTLIEHTLVASPKRSMRRSKRKFALNGWRGGIDSSYLFGEIAHPALLSHIAKKTQADAVAQFDAESPFIDASIVQGMITALEKSLDFGASFSTAPPGLGAQLYSLATLEKLVDTDQTLDEMIAYNPHDLLVEPMVNSFCHTLPLEISSCRQRFSAHSPRLMQVVSCLWDKLGEKGSRNATEVVRMYRSLLQDAALPNEFPREIEWELSPRSTVQDELRPQTKRTALADLDIVTQRLQECSAWQDCCLTLGGHGDPLLHPELPTFLKQAQKYVWGIHLSTYGAGLTKEFIEKIKAHPPDVISIKLDAQSPEKWNEFKQGADAAEIFKQIEYAHDALPTTSIIPTFIKVRENMSEMESFFDYWYEKTGWAVIEGFNTYCGTREDRNPLHLLPSSRKPCLSLQEQLVIYSDGTVPLCKQDVEGEHSRANIHDSSISTLWNEHIAPHRLAQEGGDFTQFKLCQKCLDWAHL